MFLSALAQAPGETGSLGSGSGPVMTREELRSCLQQQAALKTMVSDYEARQTQLDADRKALLAESKALRGDLGDAKSAAEKVNDMNHRTAEVLNARAVAWNERNKGMAARRRAAGPGARPVGFWVRQPALPRGRRDRDQARQVSTA